MQVETVGGGSSLFDHVKQGECDLTMWYPAVNGY